jgi:TRAP-type C4-dicarboxylate transport system substrate-binding protein
MHIPLLILLSLLLPSILLAQEKPPENVTIRYTDFEGQDSFFFQKVILPWSKRTLKSSKNTLSLSLAHVYKPSENIIASFENNQYDMARLSTFHTTNLYPPLEAFQLPFLSSNAKNTTLAMQAFIQEQEQAFRTLPVMPLLVFSTGTYALHLTKHHITQFQNSLEKLTIHTTNRPAAVFLQALGANTSIISPHPIPDLIAQTNTDGFLTPVSFSPALNALPLHVIPPSHLSISANPVMIVISRDFFLNLHPAQQKSIIQHSKMNLASWVGTLFKLHNQKIISQYAQQKKIHTLNPQSLKMWQDIATKVTTAWIQSSQKKNIPAEKIFSRVKQLLSQYAHNL